MMKYVCAAFLGIFFFCGIGLSAEKSGLEDQKARESYSLGFQFGKNMQVQGVELDLEVYSQAIRDALAGNDPRMSTDDMRATLQELQQRLALARHETLRKQGELNLAEGKTFLQENGKKDGVVTLPSGLQYKVLSAGEGKSPKPIDNVSVHYRGTLIDGREFDSSMSRGQSANFNVSGVIPGWTEALQLMKAGAKWQIFIPPDLAYGERGMPPTIPPQSTLIFEIELISIN